MANRRSQNWLNQQRVDVPHLRSIESAVRNDFDELISSFAIGESTSYILRGFEISMVQAIGSPASALQLIVAESSLFHGKSNTSGTFFQVEAGTPNEILNSNTNTKVNGAFTPSSLNYVGLELKRKVDTSTVSQLFFWNPTNKTEFSKSTPLAQILDYEIVITSTVWDSNVLPLAIVNTDTSNAVLSVEDRRPMFFRLGTAGSSSPNPFYEYPWNNHAEGRTENPFASSSSLSPFRGGDKQIKHLKEWADAVMSQIKELKGTTYWYSFNAGGSIIKLRNDVTNLVVTGSGKIIHSDATAGLLNWDQDFFLTYVTSRLKFKISANAEPGTDLILADNEVAYIRTVRGRAIIPRLIFTNGSAIVSSVGAVPWTDDVQAGDWVKLAAEDDTRYFQIDTVDSLSEVTLTEVWDGTSTGALGNLAEYAWGTYEVNASPSTDRHIRVVPRELVPFDEDVYWLFLRDDNGGPVAKVYINGNGAELEQGEEAQISDNTTLEVLAYIGSPGEADATPDYTNAVTTGVAEVTTYTFPAASSLVGGQSFNHNSSVDINKYTFYAVIDGSGSAPSAPGRITVPVPFLSTDNANEVAAAYQSVIDAQTDLSAVDNLNGTVTVTNSEVGDATDATNNDMGAGFAINVDIQGAGAPNYALIDDENLTRGIKLVDAALAQVAATVGANTWKAPVANFAALPASGNTEGDVRLVLDTRLAYHWDNVKNLWLPLTGNGVVKIIGGGVISLNSSFELSFTDDMYLEYKGLDYADNTIPTSESPITFVNDKDVAYVEPNFVAPGGNLAVIVDTLDNVPRTALIIARRDGNDVIVGSSSTRLKIGESIKLYDSITDQARDKVYGHKAGFFRSDNPVTWTGSSLIFNTDIIFETLKDDGTEQEYTVTPPIPVPLPNIEQTLGSDLVLLFNNATYGAQTFLNGAQSFDVQTVQLNLAMSGTGAGFLEIEIWGVDGSDAPDSTNVIAAANNTIDATLIPTTPTYSNFTVNFTNATLAPNTRYAIVIKADNLSSGTLQVGGSPIAGPDPLPAEKPWFAASPGTGVWFADPDPQDAYFVITGQTIAGPVGIANGEYAYIEIDRNQNTQTVTLQVGTAPGEAAPGSEIIILAKRIDVSGAGYLHLPFHKQVLQPGQTVRLGASGSGGNSVSEEVLNLRSTHSESPYIFLASSVFVADETDFVDTVNTTATFSIINSWYELDNGDLLILENILDSSYDSSIHVLQDVGVVIFFDGTPNTTGTAEVSLNGGLSWSTVILTQNNNANQLYGEVNFTTIPQNPNIKFRFTASASCKITGIGILYGNEYGSVITPLQERIVGSLIEVNAGIALFTQISEALASLGSGGGKIRLLSGTFVENVNLNLDKVLIEGSGWSSKIQGDVTINGDYNILSKLTVEGNIDNNGNNNEFDIIWDV